jgi:uncharacterized damage-inducible protein DinB
VNTPGRFLGEPFPVRSLDEEFCPDFDDLRRPRDLTDDWIEAWVASLTDERLAAVLTFTGVTRPGDTRRGERTVPLWYAVLHFFNQMVAVSTPAQ